MLTNTMFLEAVFADMMPGTHTIICGFHGDPNTKDRMQSARNWCGDPWRIGEPVPNWFDGANSYLTISSFEPNPQTGEMRRRKEQFVQAHMIMLDDIGTKVSPEKLILPLSALTETSPGNYQGFLFLKDEPDTRHRQTCERLVTRMVAAGLAVDSKDPGMTGVTRYARLPVGVNAKAKYIQRLGHPFPVRSTLFEPQRRYSIREIVDAWKLDITPDRPVAPVIPITDAMIKRTAKHFAALLDVFRALGMYHRQHGGWHEVTCPWIGTHTDRSDTGTALSEPNEQNRFAGGFVCHHGHCRNVRSIRDVRAWMHTLKTAKGSRRGR
jgi:hypothetical protein